MMTSRLSSRITLGSIYMLLTTAGITSLSAAAADNNNNVIVDISSSDSGSVTNTHRTTKQGHTSHHYVYDSDNNNANYQEEVFLPDKLLNRRLNLTKRQRKKQKKAAAAAVSALASKIEAVVNIESDTDSIEDDTTDSSAVIVTTKKKKTRRKKKNQKHQGISHDTNDMQADSKSGKGSKSDNTNTSTTKSSKTHKPTTSKPSQAPSTSGTPTPTPGSGPPAGTTYYQNFEDGPLSFPDQNDETGVGWATTNLDAPTLVWTRTDELSTNPETQIYSMKSPVLDNEIKLPSSSNLTLIMPDQGIGELHFNVKAGNQMPFDAFEYFVDGVIRGQVMVIGPNVDFEQRVLQVGPGPHKYDFVYKFNPHNMLVLPPEDDFPDRTGEVFIDEVYFIPTPATTQMPSKQPSSDMPTPAACTLKAGADQRDVCPTGEFCQLDEGVCMTKVAFWNGQCQPIPDVCIEIFQPVCGCDFITTYGNKCKAHKAGQNVAQEGQCKTDASTPLPSYEPTSIPAGATYYTSFEQFSHPGWTTFNTDNPSLVWKISSDKANSGSFAYKSPDLYNALESPAQSTLTFSMPDLGPGTLTFSVNVVHGMPYELMEYFVYDTKRGEISSSTKDSFEQRNITGIGPGPQTIKFVYHFNPYNNSLGGYEEEGGAYIDDVYYIPDDSGYREPL